MAIADKLVRYFPEQPLFSSTSLGARIEKLWGDAAAAVEHILVAGVSIGSFQPIWLEKWRRGELALIEFMALCTLQLEKEGSYVKTL